MRIKASNKILVPCFAILLLLIALMYFILSGVNGTNTVVIRQNGKIIKQTDISQLLSPMEVELGGNTVLLEKDGFSMIHADCPDKLCIKQGKITEGRGAVICLPNKVIVEFARSADRTDAVSGAR